ncbi:MAG: Fis family transcriptional regulator [Candidatus Thermoplasmatota archaeon]|nr:Fis family transcriptional regulator [Candidatus Thermoplasmatota archaeon]
MQRTPCEVMMWNGLPAIRKELAIIMIKEFGLNQRQVAEKLGITPAAVCQYLSHKRGTQDLFDKTIIQELVISVKRIMNGDDTASVVETCRICHLIQKHKKFSVLCTTQYNEKK